MNYHDFLDEYCGRVESDGTDNRRAAWTYASTGSAIYPDKYIEIFITKDTSLDDFDSYKEITILRNLGLEERISAENELNKLLGFKQYD